MKVATESLSMKRTTHENLSRSGEVAPGSERSFGVVFALVFAVVGLFPIFVSGEVLSGPLGISVAFLIVALAKPAILKPLNLLWFRFGLLLHKIVNPIVLAFLFYLVVTPGAVVLRLMGKDPLKRRFDRDVESYWIERTPARRRKR